MPLGRFKKISRAYNCIGHISFLSVLAVLIFLDETINTTEGNTGALLDANKEFGLEVNEEKTHYMFMLHHQNEKKTVA
jgi:hypothetical protein